MVHGARHQDHRTIEPERQTCWNSGALEIVFDDEDAEEIGIATGARMYQGKCWLCKGRDCHG
jgi:hypothetical protein